MKFFGALAQLVARLNGIEKVRSSTLLCSTKFLDDHFKPLIGRALRFLLLIEGLACLIVQNE
jgi:hypothetical protein